MNLYESNDTIIACSTGTISNTAIGVIRISGKSFLDKISSSFSTNLNNIEPRRAYFTKIVNDKHVLDEVVLTYFKGPNSYNGEDVLELSVHGNQLNIRRIIDLFIEKHGLRLSEPGEFTYRGMLNKKLSLSQVEGLDLLLNANSIFALDQGFSLLSGKLQDDFKNLYDSYLKHKSAVEFGFDFLEDMGEERFQEEFNTSFDSLKKSITNLYKHVSNQSFNLIKPEVTIFGLPNAGKSTLFNILLSDDRAIVSNIAGTTRDFIREDISIDNTIFSLTDTAGIRKTKDIIEEQGIDKAISVINKSFYKVLLINPFEFDSAFYEKISDIDFDTVIVTNSDRKGFEEKASFVINEVNKIFNLEIGPIEPSKSGPIEPSKSGPIEPSKSGPIEPSKSGPIEPKSISLIRDSAEIEAYLLPLISSKYKKLLDFDPVLIERHAESIKNIYTMFLGYEMALSEHSDMAIISSELNIVGHCVSELIGIISPDDVLHNIFSNFCIGK